MSTLQAKTVEEQRREHLRQWRKEHPERVKQTRKLWNEAHPGHTKEWYKRHPEVYALKSAYLEQWRRNHPGYFVEAMRKFNERHPGRQAEIMRKYYQTPKGKACSALQHAKRREHTTDPGSYAVRVELLHTLQEPCAKCHASYRITHQIDHRLALCLGGTDDWSNLQPLCILCHREKTGEDIQRLVEDQNDD